MTNTKKANNDVPENHKDGFYMRTNDGTLEKFLWDETLYLEARKDVTIVVTTKGTYYPAGRIGKGLEKMNHPTMFRCHKSFAINLKKIEGRKYNCALVNGKEIPVAKKHIRLLFG